MRKKKKKEKKHSFLFEISLESVHTFSATNFSSAFNQHGERNGVFFLFVFLLLHTLLPISLVFFLFFVAKRTVLLCLCSTFYLMASLKLKKRDYGAEPDKKKLVIAGIRHQLLLLLRRRHRLFPLVSAVSGCLLLLLLSFSFLSPPPLIHRSHLRVRFYIHFNI